MDSMVKALSKDTQTSITTDCYFTHLGWLSAHPHLPITAALSQNDLASLWPLLTHNLGYHEYRTFSISNLVLTFWMDNSIVATVSSAFSSKSPVEEGHARGVNLTGLLPTLSLEGTKLLETHLSLEDLKSLAYRYGCSSGKILLGCTRACLFANQ
jgi:hypothetical protein